MRSVLKPSCTQCYTAMCSVLEPSNTLSYKIMLLQPSCTLLNNYVFSVKALMYTVIYNYVLS